MLELLLAMLFVLVLLNIWATWRVVYDDLSAPLKKIAQSALIWVLPILGALLVLHMLRQHPEAGRAATPVNQTRVMTLVIPVAPLGGRRMLSKVRPQAPTEEGRAIDRHADLSYQRRS